MILEIGAIFFIPFTLKLATIFSFRAIQLISSQLISYQYNYKTNAKVHLID